MYDQNYDAHYPTTTEGAGASGHPVNITATEIHPTSTSPSSKEGTTPTTSPTVATQFQPSALAAESGLIPLSKSENIDTLLPRMQRFVTLMNAMHPDRMEFQAARYYLLDLLKPVCAAAAELIKDVFDATLRERRTGNRDDIGLTDPEPWPTPVETSDLLNEIRGVVARYVVTTPANLDRIALWIAHTYLFDAFGVSPILLVQSPEKACGKSTLLTVLKHLSSRAMLVSNITGAAMFRTIEAHCPTMIIDEADTFMREDSTLRGIVNSGHTKDTAFVLRTVGDDHLPAKFSTWCPKVIAGIGRQAATIEHRAIKITLQRRLRDEPVEKIRADKIAAELEPLRRKAKRWAADVVAAVRDAEPELPIELGDRAADNWRPLLKIAALADADWIARARLAATASAIADRNGEEELSLGLALLTDLRLVFHKEKMPTNLLIELLRAQSDRPWGTIDYGRGLTPIRMAKLLNDYGIKPKTIRVENTTFKGYERVAFIDAWDRFLPAAAAETMSEDRAQDHSDAEVDS